ncbi:MAG: UDP-3-O-(3-hydroxymyristoyl)glucosamine N-acyltransferase [Salibacteraceae bacterium]
MQISAQAIADILEGTVEGDGDASINGLSKIDDGVEGTLTFLSNPSYTEHIYSTKASVAIVPKDFTPEKSLPAGLSLIRVSDPRMAFGSLLKMYSQLNKPKAGIHPSAHIDPTAQIDPTAYVGPFVTIEANVRIASNVQIGSQSFIGSEASIGKESVLHPSVIIGHHCLVGEDCMLQSGVVVGGDGFGFTPNQDNHYQKVVHVGNVVIENHVEVGANTTIDRATLGSTIIRNGVKLDNLIQIAHNCDIGENTVIAAQTGIAGSAKIGKNCMIGGQVGIVGHITIADEVKIAAQSGVGNSIEEKGLVVQGSPALPIRDFKKSYVHFRNLDHIADEVRNLSRNKKTQENG